MFIDVTFHHSLYCPSKLILCSASQSSIVFLFLKLVSHEPLHLAWWKVNTAALLSHDF